MSGLRVEGLIYREHGPIDLAVPAGACVSLGGPSGAGKTLLLRALADLDPHAGRVLLDDAACDAMPAPVWRRQVAMLPAESQWWHDRVGPHLTGVDAARLAALGFAPDVLEWEIRRLSTGERQRLAVARVLANRPRALLLDEPTASLDAANIDRVEAILAAYRVEAGAATIWVSHDPAQRARVATRHYAIDDGTLSEDAPCA